MKWKKIARLFGIRAQPKRHHNMLISFPKSGRTWLRIMLNHAGIPFKLTHAGTSYGQSCHWRGLPPIEQFVGLKRTAFLIRDPRDTAVSGYFQYTKRIGREYPDINEFVLDACLGVEKIARFHLMIYDFLANGHEGHLCAYEDYHKRTVEEFSALASYFSGGLIDDDVVAAAVEFASFSNMQRMESSGELHKELGSRLRPADKNDPDSFKTRKGKIGSFRDYLDEKTIDRCHGILDSLEYWTLTERAMGHATRHLDTPRYRTTVTAGK